MTNFEAINYLIRPTQTSTKPLSEYLKQQEAYQMAIKALKIELIHCKDCVNRHTEDCPMLFIEWIEYDDDGYIECDDIWHDQTVDDGFCDRAERRRE